jgi:hypothetical protein
MEITEKKVIETKREIPVPSYWKDNYSIYKIFEREGEIFVTVVHDYYPLGKIEFQTNQSTNLIPFDKAEQVTVIEWRDARDRVIDELDKDINETETTQGSDSFYHLHASLYPLNPEKE